MSLNALLTAMKKDFAAKTDPEIVKIMENARRQLVDSGLHERAIRAGEKMPDFVLCDSEGNEFSSRDSRAKGPLLISWYRGIW